MPLQKTTASTRMIPTALSPQNSAQSPAKYPTLFRSRMTEGSSASIHTTFTVAEMRNRRSSSQPLARRRMRFVGAVGAMGRTAMNTTPARRAKNRPVPTGPNPK